MRGRTILATTVLMTCFALTSAFPQQKQQVETPLSRLTGAKNVLVTRARGSNIPYSVIRATLEGWGRFTIVEKPDQADLVIQVSTSGDDDAASLSHSNSLTPNSGNYDESSRSARALSASDITMTVFDAKNRRVLWISTETSKYAVKEKARENNLVEAAERLASKFHDRLEPPPKDTSLGQR